MYVQFSHVFLSFKHFLAFLPAYSFLYIKLNLSLSLFFFRKMLCSPINQLWVANNQIIKQTIKKSQPSQIWITITKISRSHLLKSNTHSERRIFIAKAKSPALDLFGQTRHLKTNRNFHLAHEGDSHPLNKIWANRDCDYDPWIWRYNWPMVGGYMKTNSGGWL